MKAVENAKAERVVWIVCWRLTVDRSSDLLFPPILPSRNRTFTSTKCYPSISTRKARIERSRCWILVSESGWVSLGTIPFIMHILIGSDHAGLELKHHLKEKLRAAGHTVTDKGTHVKDSVDYPDYAHAVSDAVLAEEGALGILICGSGNGVNIAANRHRGIRSALAWQPELASLARQHNNANVLALPARFINTETADAIVEAFLSGQYEGGRHQRRVQKIELED